MAWRDCRRTLFDQLNIFLRNRQGKEWYNLNLNRKQSQTLFNMGKTVANSSRIKFPSRICSILEVVQPVNFFVFNETSQINLSNLFDLHLLSMSLSLRMSQSKVSKRCPLGLLSTLYGHESLSAPHCHSQVCI